MSQIWMLQARAFEHDKRTKDATDMKVYLVPGRDYTLGKNKNACDIVVSQDRSVSGLHARLRVNVDTETETGHVLITDTSSLGTSISRDGTAIHSEEKIGKGCHGKAYHGYLVKFGVYSPFQVTRGEHMSVCLGSDLNESDQKEIEQSGFHILQGGISAMEEGKRLMAMVVADSGVVRLDDDLLLALVLDVPVVTMGWIRAWSRSIWIEKGPQVSEYATRIVYDSGHLDPEISDGGTVKYPLRENIEISKYAFVFVLEGMLSQSLSRVMRELKIYCYDMHGLSHGADWEASWRRNGQTPVVVLDDEGDRSGSIGTVLQSLGLPQSVDTYCSLNDLRGALVSGCLEGVVHQIRESEECQDGWHTVQRDDVHRRGSKGELILEDSCVNGGAQNPCTTEDKLVLKGCEKKTRKVFVKKYRGESRPDIIDLVVPGSRSEATDNEEWAALQRERMHEKLKQQAFDREETNPIGEKRIRKRKK